VQVLASVRALVQALVWGRAPVQPLVRALVQVRAAVERLP